jgi:invasion protein IalB
MWLLNSKKLNAPLVALSLVLTVVLGVPPQSVFAQGANTAVTAPKASFEDEIGGRFSEWIAAWAARQADAHLAFFDPSFPNLSAYSANRRKRISAATFIEVKAEDVQIRITGPDEAIVRFLQTYRSNSYQSKETKELVWRQTAQGPKIVSERVVAAVPAKASAVTAAPGAIAPAAPTVPAAPTSAIPSETPSAPDPAGRGIDPEKLSGSAGVQLPRTKPAQQTQRFDNWSKVCVKEAGGAESCYIQQILLDAMTKNPILSWQLAYSAQGKLASVVRTPGDVLAAKGVEISLVKDKLTPLPFRVCYEKICEASFLMEADLVQSLSSRGSVLVTFVDSKGQPVRIEVLMQGFKEAVAAIAP